jgi:hypothetical protein
MTRPGGPVTFFLRSRSIDRGSASDRDAVNSLAALLTVPRRATAKSKSAMTGGVVIGHRTVSPLRSEPRRKAKSKSDVAGAVATGHRTSSRLRSVPGRKAADFQRNHRATDFQSNHRVGCWTRSLFRTVTAAGGRRLVCTARSATSRTPRDRPPDRRPVGCRRRPPSAHDVPTGRLVLPRPAGRPGPAALRSGAAPGRRVRPRRRRRHEGYRAEGRRRAAAVRAVRAAREPVAAGESDHRRAGRAVRRRFARRRSAPGTARYALVGRGEPARRPAAGEGRGHAAKGRRRADRAPARPAAAQRPRDPRPYRAVTAAG